MKDITYNMTSGLFSNFTNHKDQDDFIDNVLSKCITASIDKEIYEKFLKTCTDPILRSNLRKAISDVSFFIYYSFYFISCYHMVFLLLKYFFKINIYHKYQLFQTQLN